MTISAGIAELTIDLSPPPGEDMPHEARLEYLSLHRSGYATSNATCVSQLLRRGPKASAGSDVGSACG